MSAPQTSLVRPAEQICSEINAVTKKAVFHKNKSEDFWETRKALVRELKKEYPEAWLGELKERCQIGRSQAFKLAAIADGRTDIEKEREKQREADRRHHESKSPSIDGFEEFGSNKAVDHAVSADVEEPQPEPVSGDAPKPPEENPREVAIRLSPKAPETPEEVAADAMLIVGAFLRQYGVDQQQTRAELIRLLTEANGVPTQETYAPTPGNGVDVAASADGMKAAFAELGADLSAAPPKRKRGRPPGSKNKAKETGAPEPAQTTRP